MLGPKKIQQITTKEEWKPTMLMLLKHGLKGHLSYGDQLQLGTATNQRERRYWSEETSKCMCYFIERQYAMKT